jgi:hypothetical protein
MQLTEHFADTDLGVAGCEPWLISNAIFLCKKLLEPIRAKFGAVHVHDGYRDPAHNARVGGKLNSYHLFESGRSAADIDVSPTGNTALFDWIRLESGLPFDEVILEYDEQGEAGTVHLQINSAADSRRIALVGKTGDGKVYTHVEVK